MSVLLQNTEKPARRSALAKTRASTDVSKLDVCFGGFTPMALSDGASSLWQVVQAGDRIKARRESLLRAAEIEKARASDVREWCDEQGTTWTYVVLDNIEVRIEGCSTSQVTLVLPAVIEEKPVVALAPDACARLAGVEEIRCPDSILSVGLCAFRENSQLRKVVLPAHLTEFDSDWFRASRKVEHLVMPDRVERLDSRMFDLPELHVLEIGSGTFDVDPGAFAKSKLESIAVSDQSPFLRTDGKALYSGDGSVLVALAVPMEHYEVLEGCKAIAKKGFSNFACVKQVSLPESLEVLGEFALARTAITQFVAPAALKHIGEKAFFNCEHLKEVTLNEGLVSIGDNAFTGTKLRALRLPASIEELGNPLAAKTHLTYAGSDATFSIAKDSIHLELDDKGALYRATEQGKRLVRMMDPAITRYEVHADTVAIDEAAFEKHAHIAEVVLPEGLAEIGKAAFKACHKLVHINIPESVESVEDEAFLDTNLASLYIPAHLERVGTNALVTHGAHHGNMKPSLHQVEVSPQNKRFYTMPGLLLERKTASTSRVLLCTGAVEVIRIPEEVDEIAPYAFNGVTGLTELYLSDRITTVGIRGLGIDGLVEHVHIDLVEPIQNHESFDLYFPETDRGVQQMMLALSVPDYVDVAALFEHYDHAIINGSSFDVKSDEGLDLYEQTTRIIARLLDPVFLTPVNRSMCERFLTYNLEDLCVEVAKHDDRKTVDALLELGYLNADNLYVVIDRISVLQDAAMTGYLLEVKRLRFQQDALDFDL